MEDPIAVRGTDIARITLDSMGQFVGLLDAQGAVLEINKAALDAAGISLAEVEGKPLWDTVWWQVSAEVLREAIARAAQGEFVRWDTPIAGKETIVLDASLNPVLDDEGKVVFICVEGRDITARKAREQEIEALWTAAESANRAKDEFLAILGHELRNPLSPIVTALQLLKLDEPGDSELARTVIERQVNHLVRLVDDLLDVTRIAQGKVELKKEMIELSEIVAKGVEVATPLLEQHRHTLRVDVPSFGLPVNADPTRLSQAVANLLTNAAKYTPPAGHIEVRARLLDDEILLSIQDNGIGIAPEVLPYVFDLFVQEGQALNRAQGGLGLGLAIVRKLAELHGGSVSARSDGLAQGSEFTIRLPRMTRS